MIYNLETVEEAYDELEPEDGFLLEEDEDHQIWLDSSFIRVLELDIDIYPGQYLQYDESENDYYADFSIYVFMKMSTKDVVYDEGYTSFGAAVHNYSQMNDKYNELNVNELKYELHQ